MKIGAIVQARMDSTRFPGKVLYEISGKPLLEYLAERLSHCRDLDGITVATSVEKSDDPIAEYCRRNNISCYRGPLLDVAARFRQALESLRLDAFVRVNADSPLLDQRLISQGIEIVRKGGYDLVTNVHPRTFPKGESVEILKSDTFCRVCPLIGDAVSREHITRYFYDNENDFKIFNFRSKEPSGGINLSVDTPEDMKFIDGIISRMTRPHWEYALEDILDMAGGLAWKS